MAKIIALDIGDQWTGIAISDFLEILAKPYKTVFVADLEQELNLLITKEQITQIIVGYPKTMRGLESNQTKKTVYTKEQLEAAFPGINFILWDERLSSKRADSISYGKINFAQKSKANFHKIKEEKLRSHSVAAAFILDAYLNYKNFYKV